MAAAIERRFELKPKDLAVVVMFNDVIMRDYCNRYEQSER